MNSEALQLLAQREADVKAAGGPEQHRLHVLQHLRLKTVVKESHCSPVHQLAFNHTDTKLNNLFATIGKDQATVYDDMHMGDYVGTVSHFTNTQTEHAKGGDLLACTWVNAGSTPHPHGDALLAVGGADCEVSVISVAESRVVALLKGHEKPIVDVCGAAGAAGVVAALSSDGAVRVWQADGERCTASFQAAGARCMALSSDGQTVVTGGARGALQLHRVGEGSAVQSQALKLSGCDEVKDMVEALRFLPSNRLALRCSSGHMAVVDMDTHAALSTWKVAGCNSLAGSAAVRCSFGTTPDGAFIAAGNHNGDVYVYETATGKRLSKCKAIRVNAPVRAAGISGDCRHVLSVLGNGYLFRYEYRMPVPTKDDKENDDGNVDVDNTDGVTPMEEDGQQ